METRPLRTEADPPPRHTSFHVERGWADAAIAALNWRSPRAILDALLVIFIFGVMFATCQYISTAKMAQRPWVGVGGLSEDTLTGDSVGQGFYSERGQENRHRSCLAKLWQFAGPSCRYKFASSDWRRAACGRKCLDRRDSATIRLQISVELMTTDRCFPPVMDPFHYTDHEPEASRPVISPLDFNDIVTGDKDLYVLGCVRY